MQEPPKIKWLVIVSILMVIIFVGIGYFLTETEEIAPLDEGVEVEQNVM